MFRILTVVLIIVSSIFFLTDVQRSRAGTSIERFNDEVVLELLHRKREAIARFDLDTVKALYSADIIIEVVAKDGNFHSGGYSELIGLVDDYGRIGQAYDKTLMSHAVIVANDGRSAVIKMEATEKWWFEDEFNNTSSSLIETQRWVLENGSPKIVSIKKQLSANDAFFFQRRERLQSSSVQDRHYSDYF